MIGKHFHIFIILLIACCIFLSGCGLKEGNIDNVIDESIRIAEEKYGVDFTLKSKAKYPKGASCDVTVTCDEVPGKKIRIFRYNSMERVNTDYINVRYGEEADRKIKEVIKGVLPDAKVITEDFCYNHFAAQDYDENTDLEEYLLHNDFHIHVFIKGSPLKGELRIDFRDLERALYANGINCKELSIFAIDNSSDFKNINECDGIPDILKYHDVSREKAYGSAQNTNLDLWETYEEDEDADNILIIMRDK